WLFFRCAEFADLSSSWSRYFLSESRQLYWIRQQRSFTNPAPARHRSVSQTRKNSIGRSGASSIHSRRELVGSTLVLATRLSRHHGYRHRAISLSLLSFSQRHARQARLRSVRACSERHGKGDRRPRQVVAKAFDLASPGLANSVGGAGQSCGVADQRHDYISVARRINNAMLK